MSRAFRMTRACRGRSTKNVREWFHPRDLGCYPTPKKNTSEEIRNSRVTNPDMMKRLGDAKDELRFRFDESVARF